MAAASVHTPRPPVASGMRKIDAEVTTAMSPATVDVKMYQRTTAPAKRPASPRRIRVAMAGLRAARMSSGTTATTQAMSVAVASATGASGPGKNPPAASPPASARIVQTYAGTLRLRRPRAVTPSSVGESGRATSRSKVYWR